MASIGVPGGYTPPNEVAVANCREHRSVLCVLQAVRARLECDAHVAQCPRIDVICFSMDGTRMVTIQVKSLSKRDTVPLGKDLDKIMGDFLVIVNSLATGKPLTYILLPHEVRAMAQRSEKTLESRIGSHPRSMPSMSLRKSGSA